MSLTQRLKDALPHDLKRLIRERRHGDDNGIFGALLSMDQNIETVFDIGANVGNLSLAFLRWFPRATVYGFEPGSQMFSRLCANIESAGFADRFRGHQIGFFDKNMEGGLHLASLDGASSMLEIGTLYHEANPHIETVATEKISLVRLDDFVREHGIKKIGLVKIDVEGVENEVLLGGAQTFREIVDAVILEISFTRHEREEGNYIKLFSTMHSLGFAPSRIFDIEQSGPNPHWNLCQIDCLFRKF